MIAQLPRAPISTINTKNKYNFEEEANIYSSKMTSKSVLIVTDKQRQAIRSKVNISADRLKEDIQAVQKWFGKQQHLPRIVLDPRIIECILICRKGSVEQTKQKIDLMYTLRNVIPEMAAPRDVLSRELQDNFKGCNFVTLPKLNHDYCRCSIVQYKDSEFFSVVHMANFLFTMIEYRLLHDYFSGERYIIDLQDISFGHLTKYTPTIVKKAEMFIGKAYGIRIFGIHIINGSNFVNKLLAIFKAGLTEKLSARICIHSTYENLHEVIDKEILPAEYGGYDRPMTEILDNWKEELAKEENRSYLIKQETLQSNESLRIGCNLDDELLGVAGSFKKLDVF